MSKRNYKADWAKNKKNMIINGTLNDYREKCRLRVAKYRHIHKEKLKKQARKRHKKDECMRLKHIVTSKMRRAIKNPNYNVYIDHLCMDSQEFRKYIAAQFEDWMDFDNHGNYSKKVRRWQIDHLRPLSSANGDVEKLKELLHFKNVRPKCAHENIRERNR